MGGTTFLGRHVVEQAQERGHRVTIFNRGQSNPDLFPGVERLTGDRNHDLSALAGRGWDACVDPSAFVPRQVRDLAEVISRSVAHYTFVSSVSVYPLTQADKGEEAPVIQLEDPASEDVNAHYGGLKALSEAAAVQAWGAERVLNSRSGLIVGPWDPTNRFTYWPVRVAAGGEVLAPGEPGRTVQFIHAADQAGWILDMAEARSAGTFNVTGRPVAMGDLLEACRAGSGSDATFTWVSDAFLTEHSVGPYMEMPLWVPPAAGLMVAPVERALAAGLNPRAISRTVRETLEWARAQPSDPPVQVDAGGRVRQRGGLRPERERELLAAWKADRDRLG